MTRIILITLGLIAILLMTTAVLAQSSAGKLAVTKSAVNATIKPGEQATFTITVANDDESQAEDVRLQDVLPPGTWFQTQPGSCSITNGILGCANIDLAPAGQEGDTFSVQVWSTPAQCGLIQNQATAYEASGKAYGSNVAAIDVLCPASVTAQKQSLPSTAKVGELVGFKIIVMNSGGVASGSIVVQDALPNDLFWILGSYDFDFCELDPAGGDEDILLCSEDSIGPRKLVVTGTTVSYQPETRYVQVYARVRECGSINNTAIIGHGPIYFSTNEAFIDVPCPSPTATPTSPPVPTATPTAPPPTATVPVVQPTPRPPDTGTGLAEPDDGGTNWLLLFGLFIFVPIGAVLIVQMRR